MERVTRVKCRVFRERSPRRFRDVIEEAALFAAERGKERLINISHAAGTWAGHIVTVWYWED